MASADRYLFGGAICCAIHERFVDVSDFKPVPDHQECFADGDADQSVVFEIVVRGPGAACCLLHGPCGSEVAGTQMQSCMQETSSTDNDSCGSFYFEDLAQVNESSVSALERVEPLGEILA